MREIGKFILKKKEYINRFPCILEGCLRYLLHSSERSALAIPSLPSFPKGPTPTTSSRPYSRLTSDGVFPEALVKFSVELIPFELIKVDRHFFSSVKFVDFRRRVVVL